MMLLTALLAFLPQVTVDAAKKEVRVPVKIAPRKLPNLAEIYPIEVVATLPAPKGNKAHETIVTFDVAPSEVHKGLESLGLKPGKPARGEGSAAGPFVDVLLDLPASGGLPARVVRAESVLIEKRTGRPLPPLRWHFTGSAPKDGKYGADLSGTLISLYPVTDEVVMQSAFTMKEEGIIKVDTAKHLLPPEGTPATLILRASTGELPAAAVAGPDPDRHVTKLSKQVGPGDIPIPAPATGGAAAAGAASDGDPKREVRGASLPDVVKPIDR